MKISNRATQSRDELSSPANFLSILSAVFAAAVICRVAIPAILGHASNFAPMNAIALFSGAYFGRRWISFLIPVVALWISDIAVNLIVLGTLNPFYPGCYWQALSYILIVGLGMLLQSGVTLPRVLAGSLGASLVFFFVSNFGVWLTSGMYPLSASGLVICFVAAIPFFGGTLLGDLFYSSLMFGSVEFARRKRFAPLALEPVSFS